MAVIGFSAVFLGLLILAAGVKIMSFCCRLLSRNREEGDKPEPT
jgi:Na+-transporting methylmalonyl-CoA/oxaloacetate decarboxylase gamma subunit